MIDGSRIKTTFKDEFELAIYYQLNDVACYSPDTDTIYMKHVERNIAVIITHEIVHMTLFHHFNEDICRRFDTIARRISL